MQPRLLAAGINWLVTGRNQELNFKFFTLKHNCANITSEDYYESQVLSSYKNCSINRKVLWEYLPSGLCPELRYAPISDSGPALGAKLLRCGGNEGDHK